MQEICIFSWNTQGDFTATAKLAEVKSLLSESIRTIGFIQEGGVGNAGAGDGYVAFPGTSVGAYNERCTNYVLMNSSYAKLMSPKHFYLVDGSDNLIVGGGAAGRTPACIGLWDVLFISWHSLAGKSNADTAAILGALESNAAYQRDYPTVVIGGDFNASPDSIRDLVNRGSVREKAGWKYKYRYVYSSGQKTHPGSGHELDFFVVLSQTPFTDTGLMANYRGIAMKSVTPSDHQPVAIKLFL